MGNTNEGEVEKNIQENEHQIKKKNPYTTEEERNISNNKNIQYNNLYSEEKSKQSDLNVSKNPQDSKTTEFPQQFYNKQIHSREQLQQVNNNIRQTTNISSQNNNYLPHQIGNHHNYNQIIYNLNLAQNYYYHACELKLKLSYSEALAKLDEAQVLVVSVYSNITDQVLKTKVDQFIKNLADAIENVNSLLNQMYKLKPIGSNKIIYNQNEIKEIFSKNNGSEKKYIVKEIEKKNVSQNPSNRIQKQELSVNQFENKSSFNNKSLIKNDSKLNSGSERSIGNIPTELINKIYNEIIDNKPNIKFEDVIGLESAKQTLKEIIILPNLRPDLFTGLRSPPRGLLLFGPPGTGKTMIAKAVATECNCTFFSISASSLTSKYLGESEKLVKALFLIAIEKQPSVIFIDEIDSILSKRCEGENDAVKRLKTEFLVQFDGVGSDLSAKVLVIGATNRPFELDNAVLRRLPKKIYIGPFNLEERIKFIEQIMKNTSNDLSQKDYRFISQYCENYSNSDLKELCKEAAYEPIRDYKDINKLKNISKLRNVNLLDFKKALKCVRGTLSKEILRELEDWNKSFGAID